jgi:hypothetical protein
METIMKHSKEFDAFTNLVDRVLSVPHSAIQERVEERLRSQVYCCPPLRVMSTWTVMLRFGITEKYRQAEQFIPREMSLGRYQVRFQ